MNFNNVIFESSFGTSNQLIESDLPEICFSGRSNVGKSSLINRIIGRKALARVSAKPGKTVTINFYLADNVRLADLPGYGYAKVDYSVKERFAELMENYFRSERNIKKVFQLLDMRREPNEDDISMLEFLCSCGIDYCIVLTKSDKLNKSEYALQLKNIQERLGNLAENVEIIPTSALNGAGTDRIRNIIESVSNEGKAD